MKTLITLVFTMLFSTLCLAQNGINYKAIIKDVNGNVIANQSISVQFTVLQGVAQTNVYQETHAPTTDANGIIIINIGEGTPVSGAFNTIDWASYTTFLNVQINSGPGTSLVDMGTTEFKAVPYAKNAETATVAANVTGLEALNESNGIGWRLIGRDPNNYGNIGSNAVDLSYSVSVSTTKGATGIYSTAIGTETEASGDYSTAIGNILTASGDFAFAIGSYNEASGSYSTSMGADTAASGYASIAMGTYTNASGDYSTAMGEWTTAPSVNSLSTGKYNVGLGNATLWVETDPLFEIGNGTSSNAKSNALTVLKNGTILAPSLDLAEITSPKALITKEYADTNLGAKGLEAINEGNGIGWRLKGRDPSFYGNIGINAVDFSYSGNSNTTKGASGNSSTAMGNTTTASGVFSTAMGFGTTASGHTSTAMGYSTTASADSSTAMGDRTTASADSSTAMGLGTTASSIASTAMGLGTTASSIASTAMGDNTTASGSRSTAMGQNTTAASYCSLAIGRYNVGLSSNATWWAATDPLFEVGFGFGPGNGALSNLNALTVLKNGMVGIGTHTPKTFLHLTNGYDANLANGTGYFMIGQETGTNLVFDNNEIMGRNNGVASSLLLQQDGGNVYVGGALVHSSDRRLKKDITPLPYGLETILQLNPVQYNWINRTQDHKSIGLIAQEVQPVINEVVSVADDEAKTLGVSYTELIPVLIKAIQEQQDLIKNQNSKIENLTAESNQKDETLKVFDTRLKQIERVLKQTNQ